MINKHLGLYGISFFVGGVVLAFIIRLANPLKILGFGFQIDPAILVLIIFLLIALTLMSVNFFLRKQELQTEKAVNAKAESFEQEHRRFIRRLDHEMKNPLTAIKIQLDNLQESTTGSMRVITDVRAQAD